MVPSREGRENLRTQSEGSPRDEQNLVKLARRGDAVGSSLVQ